jgi:hypothetical protein
LAPQGETERKILPGFSHVKILYDQQAFEESALVRIICAETTESRPDTAEEKT